MTRASVFATPVNTPPNRPRGTRRRHLPARPSSSPRRVGGPPGSHEHGARPRGPGVLRRALSPCDSSDPKAAEKGAWKVSRVCALQKDWNIGYVGATDRVNRREAGGDDTCIHSVQHTGGRPHRRAGRLPALSGISGQRPSSNIRRQCAVCFAGRDGAEGAALLGPVLGSVSCAANRRARSAGDFALRGF